MKYAALGKIYEGAEFFSKNDDETLHWEQFICIGQDGKLYEQANFEEFIPYEKPLLDSEGNDNNTDDVRANIMFEAITDDFEFAEIASGENEGEKYTVTLNTSGKAELFVEGKNAAGEDDWFPPRCDDEKWIGFFELPEGIEWA